MDACVCVWGGGGNWDDLNPCSAWEGVGWGYVSFED